MCFDLHMRDDTHEDTWQPLSLATGRLLSKVKDDPGAKHRDQETKRQNDSRESAGCEIAIARTEKIIGKN
jgi:hypothetical protein